MIVALIIGTALSLAALGFVLYPLFAGDWERERPRQQKSLPGNAVPDSDSAVVALKEIEFDHATGKLSDSDYATLRERYTQEAVEAMRAAAGEAEERTADTDERTMDAAEALVNRFRTRARICEQCGPRPEIDADYCSNCGKYLRGACNKCGSEVRELGAHFCSSCGTSLAA